ncbi:MAG: sulfatase-like hydrolase/transferase [Verrucomicrobiales bacterium]|nr:sulfatase-like hydrolase/transferase [Verrucomicrobiales bacterium]
MFSLRRARLVSVLLTSGILCSSALQAATSNVLLIIADDWAPPSQPKSGASGWSRLTAEGIRFPTVRDGHASDNTERTALWSGLWPALTGVTADDRDWRLSAALQERPSLPRWLIEKGKTTAAAGKIFHAGSGGTEQRLTGRDGGRRGFAEPAAWKKRFPDDGTQLPLLKQGQTAADSDAAVATWAADFLGQKSSKPFFLAVGLTGATGNLGSDAEAARQRVDATIAQLLEALDRGPHASRTAVILLADQAAKDTAPPLVIRTPDLKTPGQSCPAAVAWVDLFPTICDLLDVSSPKNLSGASLLPQLRDPADERPTPVAPVGSGDDAFSRPLADILGPEREEKVVGCDLLLKLGDTVPADKLPDFKNHALFIEAMLDYDPDLDANAVLISHGTPQSGYAFYFDSGKITLSVFQNAAATTVSSHVLEKGPVHVRAVMDGGGTLALSIPDRCDMLVETPFPEGFPQSISGPLLAGRDTGILRPRWHPDLAPFAGKVTLLRLQADPAPPEPKPIPKAQPVEDEAPPLQVKPALPTGSVPPAIESR